MDKKYCCCFSGNREIPSANGYTALRNAVRKAAEDLIRKGYTDFYCGGALGFDTLCAIEIIELKAVYPYLKLIIAVPFKEQSERWSPYQKIRYENLLGLADETVTVCDTPSKYAYIVRNRYMVDRCSALIYFQRKSSGGTKSTVEYAQKQGLTLIPV